MSMCIVKIPCNVVGACTSRWRPSRRQKKQTRNKAIQRNDTAVAPPIHFRRKLPLPMRYEIRTTAWYDIIQHVFSRLVESSMFETPPALLIRTLRKPPTHTWLRRACSRTCIHFKFNHVSTNRRHPPKEYYRGCTLFSVHSSAEIAMHKRVQLTLIIIKLPFIGSEPVEGARVICKIPNVRAEKNKKIGTLGSKVPTKMD